MAKTPAFRLCGAGQLQLEECGEMFWSVTQQQHCCSIVGAFNNAVYPRDLTAIPGFATAKYSSETQELFSLYFVRYSTHWDNVWSECFAFERDTCLCVRYDGLFSTNSIVRFKLLVMWCWICVGGIQTEIKLVRQFHCRHWNQTNRNPASSFRDGRTDRQTDSRCVRSFHSLCARNALNMQQEVKLLAVRSRRAL